MSDLMRTIPFSDLLDQMLGEYKRTNSMFGVALQKVYRNGGPQVMTPFGVPLGSGTGPAAGPHTQLAQNILTSYLMGGRFMELKTVQTLCGADMRSAIAKPCISAADEGYNVEWSTELTVEEARDEYIKAWFLCHTAQKLLKISPERDFSFNMSVGYSLEGITSRRIDDFLNALTDASQEKTFLECQEELLTRLEHLPGLTREEVLGISPRICDTLALSTMHGCPKGEIQAIVEHLLIHKHLNVFLKCNPTLLGYETARGLLDQLGFDYLDFDERHFQADLKFEEAVEMLEGLLATAHKEGVTFGVKLTNTFPVNITKGELPGEQMYSSGRALLPLSVHVAKKLSAVFGDRLPMAYSGGADALNIQGFLAAGILPVTVCTTLLKPGGYERLAQVAKAAEGAAPLRYQGPNAKKIAELAEAVLLDPRNQKEFREPVASRKNDTPLPLFDCFQAPCQEGGCPIEQKIPAYLEAVSEGAYERAMEIIATDNALPSILGEICYHPCTAKCTRQDVDQSLDIRKMKHLATQKAQESYLKTLSAPAPQGPKVLVVGAGVQGLSLAYYLSRAGFQVTVAEKKDKPFGLLNGIMAKTGLSERAMELDLALIEASGAKIICNVDQEHLLALSKDAKIRISTTGKPEGLEAVRLTRKDRKTKLQAVYAMAAAKELAYELIAEEGGKPVSEASVRSTPSAKGIYARRGLLELRSKGPEEARRCLSCDAICEVCKEVCPNRANVAIALAGFDNPHQILHLDYSCNECGNCTTFCPHSGSPYLDKVTLFGTEGDLRESANVGFCFFGAERVLLRDEAGELKEMDLGDLPEGPLYVLIRAVATNHRHLIVDFGGTL
ncbi:Glutamate synthase [NADPH] small chain [Clostridiaceae bacterium JG1575]|nr:Glutamate synthase [NADPH] small chain [Clostridiaceae bacterium JG1575]